ncbi:MAG: hypothetical protein R2705_20460 [Ilumatobacteraceae bacterium]
MTVTGRNKRADLPTLGWSLYSLADYKLDQVGGDALAQRADIVEQANTILRQMVVDVGNVAYSSDKAGRVIPLWLRRLEHVPRRPRRLRRPTAHRRRRWIRRDDGRRITDLEVHHRLRRRQQHEELSGPLDLAT